MSPSFEDLLNNIAAEPTLHTSNLYILSKMDRDSFKTFEAAWPAIPSQRRRDIMRELVEISEANFEVSFDPVFLLGLADEDAEVRTSAINGLWEYEHPSLVEPLVHLLRSDPAASVRAAAAIALGQFLYLGEVEKIDQNYANLAKEALLETIRHSAEDIDVRRRAVESIAYSSDPTVASIIENAYYDDNERMRVSAIFAMGRSADAYWWPQVVAELDNPNSEIRFEAVRACGELELRDAIARLVNLVDEDPDLEVQEMAIWAMGRIGGPLAREALEDYLDSEVEALALAAEEAIDELNLFSDDSSLMLYDFGDGDFEEPFEFNDNEADGDDEFDLADDDDDLYEFS